MPTLKETTTNLQATASDNLRAQDAAIAALKAVPELIKAAAAGGNHAELAAVSAALSALSVTIAAKTTEIMEALKVVGTPVESTPFKLVVEPLSLATVARSADVLSRWGVCTHFNYTDGQHANANAAMDAIRFIGLNTIRDTNFDPGDQGQDALRNVAAAGFKVVAITRGGVDVPTTIARLKQFVGDKPDALAAIEGPNEINNQPFPGGEAGAQAFMRDLYSAVRADPALKNVPVYGFTNWPASGSKSDALSIHPYAKEGAQPRATMERDLAESRAAESRQGFDPQKAFAITETGYHTANPGGNGWEGVDGQTQAKMLGNTYCDAALLGAAHCCAYQLLDERADTSPEGNSQEQHFGMFNFPDFSPKPAAVMMRNLTSLLRDDAPDARTFTTTPAQVSVSDAPPTGKSFVLQKSDGSHLVVTWAEPKCWDHVTHKPINVAPVKQTIAFGRSVAKVAVYDPLRSAEPILALDNAMRVTVDITDHPLVITLSA